MSSTAMFDYIVSCLIKSIARSLEPTLTAHHHHDQHNPRPKRLAIQKQLKLVASIPLKGQPDQICGAPGHLTINVKTKLP